MNVYEIQYLEKFNARKVSIAVRFGKTEDEAKRGLIEQGCYIKSVKLLGEHGGMFCTNYLTKNA